jgi:hypothetical protein
MLRRFSDFLLASPFFNQIIVLAACLQKTCGFARNWPLARAKFACDWRPVAYNLYPSGRQSYQKFREDQVLGEDPDAGESLLATVASSSEFLSGVTDTGQLVLSYSHKKWIHLTNFWLIKI